MIGSVRYRAISKPYTAATQAHCKGSSEKVRQRGAGNANMARALLLNAGRGGSVQRFPLLRRQSAGTMILSLGHDVCAAV